VVAPASLQIVKEHLLEAIIVQEMKEIRYMLACACIQASCTVHGAVTPSPLTYVLTECQLMHCDVLCVCIVALVTHREALRLMFGKIASSDFPQVGYWSFVRP